MVIAGHETVAAALAWTLMLLAEHPEAQERVRSELDAHPGPVPLVGHRERAAVDARRRRRGAAPLPAGLGHLPPLAPRRRGRRAAGPGRHARHHQPLAGPPASRPLARARGLPSRALPRRHRPHRLPAVRAGTAAVHRARVRARRDGRRPRRAAARAPHRRARRSGRLDAARSRRPRSPCTPAAACRSSYDGRARRDGCPPRRPRARACCSSERRCGRSGWWPTSAPCRGPTPPTRTLAGRRCRWWSRRATRSRPCPRCCGRWPSSCRTVREVVVVDDASARRDRRRGARGRRPRRAGRHAAARVDRQGVGLPHRRRGDDGRPPALPRRRHRPRDRVPSPACSPRTPGTAGSCRCSRTTTSYAPTSSCRPTSTSSR